MAARTGNEVPGKTGSTTAAESDFRARRVFDRRLYIAEAE